MNVMSVMSLCIPRRFKRMIFLFRTYLHQSQVTARVSDLAVLWGRKPGRYLDKDLRWPLGQGLHKQ